jgi:hypothetical protein
MNENRVVVQRVRRGAPSRGLAGDSHFIIDTRRLLSGPDRQGCSAAVVRTSVWHDWYRSTTGCALPQHA